MTTEPGSDTQLALRLIDQMAQRQGAVMPALSLAASVAALAISGVTAFVVLGHPMPTAAPVALAAQTAPAATPPGSATLPVLPAATPSASPGAPGPQGGSTRIAQSQDGSIYAFDPGTGLAFQFDPSQAGPTPISTDQLPDDIQPRLLSGAGAGAPVIDAAAVEDQTARARALLASQSTDQTRPPLNQILSDPKVAADIAGSLDRAQGILRPGARPEGGDEDGAPVIYAFFDPQCPYCHAAFERLDGRYSVKWMPLSVLGPDGDPLNSYIMDEVTLAEATLDSGDVVPNATLSDDPARGQRLADIMQGSARPPEAELDEAQRFVLDENAELFRLLSRGAEEMRAVPTFFVREPDGTAVWLRGFDDGTADEIADIVAGKDAT